MHLFYLQKEIQIVVAVAACTATAAARAAAAGQSVARAVFHYDDLGRRVEDVPLGDSGFNDYDSGPRYKSGDCHRAVFAGSVLANEIAAAVLNGKLRVGDGLSGDGIHLPDGQAAQGIIVKIERLCVIRLDLHSLRPVGVADGVPRDRILLGHYQCADYTLEHDLSVLIAIGNPPLLLNK